MFQLLTAKICYLGGPYNFILNMLLGQVMYHQNKSLQIIPVYLDVSTHEDVPFFLSEYQCYSLPSHVQDLCLALRSEDHVNSDFSNDDVFNKIAPDVNNLKSAVEMMAKNHNGYKKLKHDMTTIL